MQDVSEPGGLLKERVVDVVYLKKNILENVRKTEGCLFTRTKKTICGSPALKKNTYSYEAEKIVKKLRHQSLSVSGYCTCTLEALEAFCMPSEQKKSHRGGRGGG